MKKLHELHCKDGAGTVDTKNITLAWPTYSVTNEWRQIVYFLSASDYFFLCVYDFCLPLTALSTSLLFVKTINQNFNHRFTANSYRPLLLHEETDM